MSSPGPMEPRGEPARRPRGAAGDPSGSVVNGLRAARLRLGLSQQELAARAGVTRQAVSAIEGGQAAPSLGVALRLARALGCRVEDLFWLDDPEPEVEVELVGTGVEDPEPQGAPASRPAGPGGSAGSGGPGHAGPDASGGRCLVARIGGRWVAHRLWGDGAFSSDLLPAGARLVGPASDEPAGPAQPGRAPGEPPAAPPPALTRWRARLLESPEDLARGVLIAGCAPELSLWARALATGHRGVHLHRIEANSHRAVQLLRAGTVHAAGVHLPGPAGEPDNLPFLQDLLGDLDVVVVRLGVWEEGLVVAPGNPLGIRDVADLARPGVMVVNREPGAGSRLLLERCLAEAGVPAGAVAGFDRHARSHLEVARAVARGTAHAGVSTAPVAAAFGLGFVPLRAVAYDLVFPRTVLDEPAVQALLGTLGDAWVRRQLAALGGFDTAATGTVTARLSRAHGPRVPAIGSL